MNQKKVKAIRQVLRQRGVDPANVETLPLKGHFVTVGFGHLARSAYFLGDRLLKPECGRRQYRDLKATLAR